MTTEYYQWVILRPAGGIGEHFVRKANYGCPATELLVPRTIAHDLGSPLSRTQAAQREEALQQVISGDAPIRNLDGSKVVQLKSKKGDPKYVELGREKTDKIFTVLVEFGDQVDSTYGGTPGPLHNQIAQPDREKNNSTAWRADYTASTTNNCSSARARRPSR